MCCQRAVAGESDVLGRVVEAMVGAPGSCHEFPGLASATPVMARASLAPTRLRDCLSVPGRRWEGRLGVRVILRVAEGDPTVAAVAEEAVSEEARRPDSEGPWRRELLLRLIRPGAARWRTILHPGRERRLERKGGCRDLGGHRRGAGGCAGSLGRDDLRRRGEVDAEAGVATGGGVEAELSSDRWANEFVDTLPLLVVLL